MTGIRESSAVVEPARVQALAALFDDLPAPDVGEPLPPLWHWAALQDWPAAGTTGPDGHPATGGFMPDTGLPRRMFAGGRVTLHSALPVGARVRRQDEVLSVTTKDGRSGRLVIVVVETRILVPDRAGVERPVLEERQDIIYRSAADPTEPRPDPLPQPPRAHRLLTPAGDTAWAFATDPSTLMRFSAATSNGHRIHYDWPYATQVEGYPGLVVHGPLMTLSLAEAHRRSRPDAAVTRLTHRSVAPLFAGQDARVTSRETGEGNHLLELTSGDGETTHTTLDIS